MDDPILPSDPLSLLARLYRERRSGVLSMGSGNDALCVLLRDGQVIGLGPTSGPLPFSVPPKPRPDDSARRRLERVLAEIGMRSPASASASASAPSSTPPRDLRGRLLETLAEGSLAARFEEGAEAPSDLAETAGATEPLVLEAVRLMRDAATVRTALGDLDQRLVVTAALADERTLTLTEGYLLSRIDEVTSARQVLQLVPLDPEETARTLLGLVLTGRVEYRQAPPPRVAQRLETAAPPRIQEQPAGPAGPPLQSPPEAEAATRDEALEQAPSIEIEVPPATPEPQPHAPPVAAAPQRVPAPELDRGTLERRKEILEIFQSLPVKNHFEVLGVEPGCGDADVKRAYSSLAKRFHPDVNRDPRIEDLRDMLEAIFIRVGEAWEVLGDAKSRASYEARSGVVRRPREGVPSRPGPPAPAPAPEPEAYVTPEETLQQAQLLIAQARYWDAIQVLEAALPQMEPRRHQNRGRILLAKAYAKNPNWVRRAEETLQHVVREDPVNVEAHYELGVLYKAGGLAARAQAMFRRVVELRPDHREAAAELGPGEGPGGGGLLKRLFGRGKAS